MTKELTELTKKYYSLINNPKGDCFHKDRDCHFYINEAYSYGQEPTFQFQHFGYCYDVEQFFRSKEGQYFYEQYIEQAEKEFEKAKQGLGQVITEARLGQTEASRFLETLEKMHHKF